MMVGGSLTNPRNGSLTTTVPIASPMHWFQRCFLSRDLTKEPTLSWQKLRMFPNWINLRSYPGLQGIMYDYILPKTVYYLCLSTTECVKPISPITMDLSNMFFLPNPLQAIHVMWEVFFYRGSEILFYLLAEQIIQKMPLFSGEASLPANQPRRYPQQDLTPFP